MIPLAQAVLIAALLSMPALAQTPADGPSPLPAHGMRMERGAMFGAVSPEGRRILGDAMRSVTREDRMALRAARDRINDLVAADQLDMAALGQAMAAERRLVDALHARRQAALMAALPKLSREDRQAFAEDARAGRDNVEARAAQWRQRLDAHRARMRQAPPQ